MSTHDSTGCTPATKDGGQGAVTAIALKNGLCLKLQGSSRHYFGGYFHVTVTAWCDVPLEAGYFASEADYVTFLTRSGDCIRFEKKLEKMAVPEADIATIHRHLTATFTTTVLPYLNAPGFARNFVRREAEKLARQSLRFPVSRNVSL